MPTFPSPDTIEGTSLRAARRVKVDIPAQLALLRPYALASNVFLVNLSFTLIAQPGNLRSWFMPRPA
ncbi:MAG: hypothetical protein V4463_14360 [Pseudomonadota bacterium]